jgi:hypothetical protein
MDPPEEVPAAAAPPSTRGARVVLRRGARVVEFIFMNAICFVTLSLLKLEPLARNSVQNHHSDIDLPRIDEQSKNLSSTPSSSSVQKVVQNSTTQLTSGVGLVTTDGQWVISPDVSAKYDVKILGFTDSNYVPIAKTWYDRLTKLGYNEHYIVAHEKAAYDDLMSQSYRVMPCFIENPDYRSRGECCIINMQFGGTSCVVFCGTLSAHYLTGLCGCFHILSITYSYGILQTNYVRTGETCTRYGEEWDSYHVDRCRQCLFPLC